ncbi:MAG: MATE family efflux transporter [Lachnospiraceae bacterium]|nr:MATE family efflux transporter [Lachnospiraceae bacterium]
MGVDIVTNEKNKISIKKSKSYEIDMCNGPLLGKIIVFYIPLMLSSVLQLLFNAADVIVVGRFAGDEALAAVGSTGSLINLLVNVFIGLSVGTNVLVSRFFGAGQKKDLDDMVHTSILTSIISGVALVFVGLFLAPIALRLMAVPEDVIDLSILYLRIYFAGMPVMMAYNFGSAILRAVGDTKRPLYYLLIAGVVNVILNLIFVIPLHMSVAGVALATVIAQGLSAFLVLRCLVRTDSDYRLDLRRLRIERDKLLKMIQIGLPAGLQGALFSVSNVLIQSSVNSFGKIAMAGNTAACNIEGFVYVSMNALHQASVSFTGQNYGAKKFDRIGKILAICLALVIGVGIVLGNGAYLTGGTLLKLYTDNPEAIAYGVLRLSVICTTYCLCGMMDVIVGSIRGMGYGIMPMLVSLTGACLFRVVWIFTVFQRIHTLECLYVSYPISWALTFAVHLICFFIVFRLEKKKIS